jgi:hypothetical protein
METMSFTPTDQPAVVVAQASGSGKTKLAFSVGMYAIPTIVIRVAGFGLTSSWLAVALVLNQSKMFLGEKWCFEWEEPLMAVALLVSVEWSTLVVRSVREAIDRRYCTPANFRRALLVANRNGVADVACEQLVNVRLREVLSLLSGGSGPTNVSKYLLDMASAWEDEAKAWDDESDGTLHVSIDEVQGLNGASLGVFRRSGGGAADLLHGVVAGMCYIRALFRSRSNAVSAAPTRAWVFSVCGTDPDLEHILETNVSPLKAMGKTGFAVSPSTFVTLDNMVEESLALHFPTLQLGGEDLSLLAQLSGRPRFFFEFFWCALVRLLRTGTPVREALVPALRTGIAKATRKLEDLWSKWISVNGSRTVGVTRRVLFGGKDFEADDALKRAMRHGLLVLHDDGQASGARAARTVTWSNPVSEPLVMAALSRTLSKRHLWTTLAYELAKQASSSSAEAGLVWEQALAGKLLAVGTDGKTLAEFGEEFPVEGFVMPELAKRVRIKVARLASGQEVGWRAIESDESAVLVDVAAVNMSPFCGADAVVVGRDELDGGLCVVSIQLKTGKHANFLSALLSTDPRRQCEPVRDRRERTRSTGKALCRVRATHHAFLDRAHFAKTIRVVAHGGGFDSALVGRVNMYNSTSGDSPILLFAAMQDHCTMFAQTLRERGAMMDDHSAASEWHLRRDSVADSDSEA